MSGRADHFPDEEAPTSATPRGRAEVETATASVPEHGPTPVKLAPADAALASFREQAFSPIPPLLARYEILSLLGQGGMGVVYRARDRASGEVVAVKVLLERRASAVERFAREAAVLSRLDHPGIVRYGAHGVTDAGEPYLAMEWLDGESLSGRFGRGVLSVDETLTLATQVSEALAAAHARGVVHRDLKPSNLFLVDRDIRQIGDERRSITCAPRITRTAPMTWTRSCRASSEDSAAILRESRGSPC